MIYKSFEEYLIGLVMETFPEYTDDDYPDVYDRWLAEQSTDDLLGYANRYAEIRATETELKTLKEVRGFINKGGKK